MANNSYIILKFTNLKNLTDFVRASHITSYELNVAKMTLASNFQGGNIDLALTYGATLMNSNDVHQPAKT